MLRRWLSHFNSRKIEIGMPIGISSSDINLYHLSRWGAKEQREFGFKSSNAIQPWPLKLPLDWTADPFNDSNWKFSLHSWRMTDPILNDYFATGDSGLLREAYRFVEDWRRYHYVSKQTTDFSWYDMAAGIRALRIAFFLDRAYSGELRLSASELHGLHEMADDHARRLQDEAYINLNNHGLFQVFGLHLLCSVAKALPACAAGKEFARAMYKKIFDGQFTQDGVHCEHSPHYHIFALRRITALSSVNGIKDDHVDTIIEKARRILPWLTFPNGRLASVGDSDGRTAPLKQVQDTEVCRLGNGLPYAVGDFTKSGYAVVRSLPETPLEEQSMLFVTGMMWSHTHKHADDLSFELFEYGRFVLIDSGKYGYIKDGMRDYVESAAAHNTIGLETTAILPRQLKPYGSALDGIRPKGDHFEITGTLRRPGVFIQSRRLLYRPGEFLVIRDYVEPTSSERLVSSLHFAPDLELHLVDRTAEAALDAGRSVQINLLDSDCELTTVRGQQDPILGWSTAGYLKMEPTTVLRAVCPSHTRTITWVVSFNEAAQVRATELAASLD